MHAALYIKQFVRKLNYAGYLTIIPQARMGSESIAHEAEGWMHYWLRGHGGERNNSIGDIVCEKSIETKHLSLVKPRLLFLLPKHYKYGWRFSLLVAYKYVNQSESSIDNRPQVGFH